MDSQDEDEPLIRIGWRFQLIASRPLEPVANGRSPRDILENLV